MTIDSPWSPENFHKVWSQIEHVLPHITKAAQCIYMNKRRPEPIGSGVLLRIGEARFLLTATHVLNKFVETPTWLGREHHWVSIIGEKQMARQVGSSGFGAPDDQCDAVVVRLREDLVFDDSFVFLTLSDLDIRDWMAPSEAYVVSGFRSADPKYLYDRLRVEPRRFLYSGPRASLSQYRDAELPPQPYIAIPYDRSNVISDSHLPTAPSPRGASGGGVWAVSQIVDPDTTRPAKLAGILTGYDERRNNLLVATRVCCHTELIRAAWPELRQNIGDYGGPPEQFG